MLEISLFGGLTIKENGKPVTGLVSRRAEAILAYLAYAEQTHTREVLADLFWDDRSQAQAMTNLRVVLSSLRKRLKPYLIITRQTVSINTAANYALDATEFVASLNVWRKKRGDVNALTDEDAANIKRAIALYRGDFLAGFYLRESRGFEEWALLERERLRRLMIEGLQTLATHNMNSGEYERGIDYVTRLLELDPLREEAHRQRMLLLARAGQRNAALKQYLACREILLNELGVEPMVPTTQLYNRLKAITEVGAHNLPPQTTPFVGREQELADLSGCLLTPNIQLLTLVGPGGIGKTRLAIQAAQQCRNAFLNGVCFVSLAAVQSAENLAPAIADALQMAFHSPDKFDEQLIDHLREQEMLLTLDNYEHLISSSTALLVKILSEASEVTLLVTSRQRLNLLAETTLDVYGLSVPPPDTLERASHYSAVALFLQIARRVRANFNPTAQDIAYIIAVCRLVEGMPLAIELAASWIRVLSCREIASEIEQGLEFLSASLQDAPRRHRSVNAVFDHSWQLLSQNEQRIFRQLSVFQGSFSRQAAKSVTGASLNILSNLVDKSMVQQTMQSRFIIHTLLKQYAAAKLNARPAEKAQVQQARALYYTNVLRQRETELLYSRQKEAAAEINLTIDNIRAAWLWAVESQHFETLSLALEGLYFYYWSAGWYFEAKEMFTKALAVVSKQSDHQLLMARLQLHLAEFEIWLGNYAAAGKLLEKSVPVLRRNQAEKDYAFALEVKGMLLYFQGRFAQAKRQFEKALPALRQIGEPYYIALALNTLANVICDGYADYDQAKRLYEESLALTRQIGDQNGAARALINMAEMHFSQKQYETARQLTQESLQLYRNLNYTYGISAALNVLARIAGKMGKPDRAKPLIEEGLELNRQTGQRQQITISLKHLGHINCQLGDFIAARQNYKEALRLSMEIEVTHLYFDTLTGVILLLEAEGKRNRALEMAAALVNQPIQGQELQNRIDDTFSTVTANLSPEEIAAYREAGKSTSLETIVAGFLAY